MRRVTRGKISGAKFLGVSTATRLDDSRAFPERSKRGAFLGVVRGEIPRAELYRAPILLEIHHASSFRETPVKRRTEAS